MFDWLLGVVVHLLEDLLLDGLVVLVAEPKSSRFDIGGFHSLLVAVERT